VIFGLLLLAFIWLFTYSRNRLPRS
jgi:hypothetical protein